MLFETPTANKWRDRHKKARRSASPRYRDFIGKQSPHKDRVRRWSRCARQRVSATAKSSPLPISRVRAIPPSTERTRRRRSACFGKEAAECAADKDNQEIANGAAPWSPVTTYAGFSHHVQP